MFQRARMRKGENQTEMKKGEKGEGKKEFGRIERRIKGVLMECKMVRINKSILDEQLTMLMQTMQL